MKVWIVWLPNVWKSTLFNALTNSYAADAANFPFCTIEPNIGIVDVKDKRIDELSRMSQTKKTVYAAIKFVDIAGLVKWASTGEWMGNKFLSHIREVDAIVQVLRHFEDNDIGHVDGNVDALRDAETINTELIFSDLEQVDKKLSWLTVKVKQKDKVALQEFEVLTRCKSCLESGTLLHDLSKELTDEQKKFVSGYNFLTYKPFVYAINVSQEELQQADVIQKMYEQKLNKPVAIVCAKLEHEMIWLETQEKEEFLQDALEGTNFVEIPTLDTLIQKAFDAVGLMYYFTTGEKETRARTVKKNSTAPQAAAAIHTDFERWFIKAEIVAYEDLIVAWSRSKAREQWKLWLQWKEYIVQDGDVIVFKFNV